jgi:putative hydrolase of the HAD superfamily
MSEIRAVVFDLFGTLVPRWSAELAAARNASIAEDLGVSAEDFEVAWQKTFSDRECGRLASVPDAIRSMLPRLGIEADDEQLQTAAERSFVLHRSRIVPRDDVEATLLALRERGLFLGLLSNISAPGPDVFRALSIAGQFRSLIFSNEFGAEKPEPTIYGKSIEELGVPAASCLFVGDGGSRELTGASRAGMNAVLIRVDAEIEEEGWLDDAAEWQGPTISSIHQVLGLVDR